MLRLAASAGCEHWQNVSCCCGCLLVDSVEEDVGGGIESVVLQAGDGEALHLHSVQPGVVGHVVFAWHLD